MPQSRTANAQIEMTLLNINVAPNGARRPESPARLPIITGIKNIKDAGASVYTIGVMDGANDTFPPSNFSNLDNFNKYMHLVSSNYPNATAMNATGARKSDTSSSFYLAAGNASRLSEIFQSIAQNIETGGVKATLGSTTVMKDVISDYFEIIPGSEKVYTAPYLGYNEDSSRKFGARTAYAGATVRESADGKTLDVTGFDYSANANCVMDTNNNGTMTYSGKKLIVELKVRAKGQFLGGNEVPTNENTSGLYKDGTTSVEKFEVPVVDVPVKTPLVNVTAADKNVYITGSLTKAQLVSGAQVTCGIAGSSDKINLNLSAENFGLESWQNAYSTVTYQVKDANGVVVLDNESNRTDALRNLQDDTTYSLTVYITPDYSGTYTATNGSDTGNVNVFVPSMTFKDSNVWYGDVAPGDAYFASAGNRVGQTEWTHAAADGATTNSTAVTMLGSKPALTYGYNIPSSVVSGGDNSIITTKADIPVTVTVKAAPAGGSAVDITGKTTKTHQKCSDSENITEGADLMLHVNTCSLTLTKSIGTNNPGADPDEDYIFKIAGPGLMGGTMEITLKKNETRTIAELPVGSYTVTEDTHWSWRWTPSFSNGGTATLSKDNASARITCTNNSNGKTQWLNGYDNAVNVRTGNSDSSRNTNNGLQDLVMVTSLYTDKLDEDSEKDDETGGEE